MAHYYFGGGASVTLADIGHLQEVVEQYSYLDKGIGAFRRLSNQNAVEARSVRTGEVNIAFENNYDFGDVEFSHGFGVVKGEFTGTSVRIESILRIKGSCRFEFTDSFEDPVGVGFEVGGEPYRISGRWGASFTGEVLDDPAVSEYR